MRQSKLLSSEYATFRPEILDYLRDEVLTEPVTILDPMAGTAPLVPFVETHGHKAYFNDILPLHSIVNRAKTYEAYQCYLERGHDWFLQRLLESMATLEGKRLRISHEWIDDAVLEGLAAAWRESEEYDRPIATLMKATIMVCVRPFSSITRTSNPTWFKRGGVSSDKDLCEIVRESLGRFEAYYETAYGVSTLTTRGQCVFTARDATELSLPEEVDVILTSPPYCNRLDSLVQYGPENYFLRSVGLAIPETDVVIGTTKVQGYKTFAADFDHVTAGAEFASKFLNRVRNSRKRDDRTYYLPYYTRYFAMLSRTLGTALRHLSAKGTAYVVVQDNGHRGQLIEIDKVIGEVLAAEGWQVQVVKKWERHHLGLRNVSRDHAFVKPMQFEKLVVIWR